MGYEASFKIKEALDDRFKPIFREIKKDDIAKHRVILVATCMLEKKSDNSFDLHKIYEDIAIATRLYITYLTEDWKHDLKKSLEKDNEVTVCGWEYSDTGRTHLDINELTNDIIERLFYISIDKSISILEDSEKYYNKLNLIKSELDELPDLIYDILMYDLYCTYKDKENSEFNESY